jgi:thymidylate kinase
MKPSPSLPVVGEPGGQSPAAGDPPSISAEKAVLRLVRNLCKELSEQGINYCHWKSNNALDRSASGENDLDLLISRADAGNFIDILVRMGFKRVIAPFEKQMPGVEDYYAFDEDGGCWVHVHAHYQLIMGHDMTKNFHLAIEMPYLQSSRQGKLFRVPAVEFEYIVLVIRMVLKYATLDAILTREGQLKKSEKKELADLSGQVNHAQINKILHEHLPYISSNLFSDSTRALQPGCSLLIRITTAHRLMQALQTSSHYPIAVDTWLKLWRRGILAGQHRLFKRFGKNQPAHGGMTIAMVGGDGAGKSTVIDSLYLWLSELFDCRRVHMGKPEWSKTTIAIRFILKIGQVLGLYPLETSFEETLQQNSRVSPGYPFLIREVCRARDRYHLFEKAERYVAAGGIMIFDRFPVDQIKQMDGPQIQRFIHELEASLNTHLPLTPKSTHPFARYLAQREESYYRKITTPTLTAVLRLQPETAVKRKTEEKPEFVYRRSNEIWQIDWSQTSIHAIDANQSKMNVFSELRHLIWKQF